MGGLKFRVSIPSAVTGERAGEKQCREAEGEEETGAGREVRGIRQ